MTVLLEDEVLNDLRDALGCGPLAHLLDELPLEILRQRCTMLDAWDRREFDEVRRAAHSLKGSVGTLGAIGLSGLCLRLEQMAAAGDADGVQAGLAALESATLPHIAECFGRSAAERQAA